MQNDEFYKVVSLTLWTKKQLQLSNEELLDLDEIATEEFTNLWFKTGEKLRNKFLAEKENYG